MDKDPLNEYKQEAFLMFENMMKQVRQMFQKLSALLKYTDIPENNKNT